MLLNIYCYQNMFYLLYICEIFAIIYVHYYLGVLYEKISSNITNIVTVTV